MEVWDLLLLLFLEGWSWLYGSWIYNYLCNRRLSWSYGSL